MPKIFDIKMMEGSERAEVRIYGNIVDNDWYGDQAGANELTKEIDEINAAEIDVRIHSYGGSVYAGWAIYNALKRHDAHVTTYIDGIAASMASLIFLAGDTRNAAENSIYMIHNAWSGAIGDANEFEKAATVLRKLDNQAVKLYSKLSGESEETIREYMEHETHFTADEAMQIGLVHNLTEETIANESMLLTAKQMKQYGIPRDVAAHWQKPKAKKTKITKPKLTKPTKPTEPAQADNEVTEMTPEEIAAKKAADKKALNDAGKNAVEKNTARQLEVNAAVDKYKDQMTAERAAEIKELAITDSTIDASAVAKLVLDDLSKDDAPGAPAVHVKDDERGPNAMKSLLTAYATKDEAAMAENPYKAYSTLELARESMRINNVSDAGMGKIEIAQQIVRTASMQHSTTDFGALVRASAEIAVVDAFQAFESNILQIASEGTVTDLRPQESAVIGEFSPLLLVPEGDEYVYGTLSSSLEAIQVAKYGRKFNLTEESVINDTFLDILSRVPTSMGRQVGKTEERLVLARLVDTNLTLSDGLPLFDAAHNNDHTGMPLSAASLSTLKTNMRLQKDSDGNTLGAVPSILLVPAALEDSALTLVQSATPPGATNSGVQNIHQNSVRVVVAPELDAIDDTQYYLFADPQDAPGLQITRLRGYGNPGVVQSAEMADIDGTEFKVRHFAAGSAIGYQGVQRAKA